MKLYLKYFSIHLRCAMQYKISFLLTLIGQAVSSFSMFIAVYFLFDRFHEVEGFSFAEVSLCFSTILMAFSLAEVFARGFDLFPTMIANGEFDRILVRPRNEIFQILAYKMEFTRLGRLLEAVVILTWAMNNVNIIWSAEKFLVLSAMVICGAMVFSGLFLLYAGICFFTLEGLEFMNIFTDGGREFGSYPFSVYGREILRFFTFIIPLALVQYYPLLYLTGRSHRLLFAWCPILACLFLLPCYLFWRIGVRHFKSTGS